MIAAPALVGGRQPLVDGWSIELPFPMAKRNEDGSRVFWHTPKSLTFWMDVWGWPPKKPDARSEYEHLKAERSKSAYALHEESTGQVLRFCYRLLEKADDGRQAGFYGTVVDRRRRGFVHFAAYFNHERSSAFAASAWRSITPAAG